MRTTSAKVTKLEQLTDDRIREEIQKMTSAEFALYMMRHMRRVEARLGNQARVAELDAEIAELESKVISGGFTDPVTEQWCKEYVAELQRSLEEHMAEEYGYAQPQRPG